MLPNLKMFEHILTDESKFIYHYIDLNFPVCKIIEFAPQFLRELLYTLGLSQVVSKRVSTEACRNRSFDVTKHHQNIHY